MAQTTLILGAGLGKEYGFPDGAELWDLIAHELEAHDHKLKKILEVYHAPTVDEVAATYPQHAAQIRQITTKILWERENKALAHQRVNPNVYKLLIRQASQAQSQGRKVNIINFNYDRSLAYILHEINSVEERSDRKLDPGLIKTVYGRLAPLWFERIPGTTHRKCQHDEYGDRGGTPQDTNADYWRTQGEDELFQQSTIAFIGERNAPKPEDLGTIMKSSDQIFFLGVGYHKANMDLLDFDFSVNQPGRLIAGTGYGLDNDEIKALFEQYPAIDRIEKCKADVFLKSKFDVSAPDSNFKKKPQGIIDAELRIGK